ncbi:MAG: Uma2 family endonuclease, partial [Candidatus Hydrogenedentes bacterium]|nr:Uma2 family endonuclease [Candidatus Hydrogenedentota bacterium]
MAIQIQERRFMTAEELAAPGIPEKFVELIEGELIETAPADWHHNRLASELEFLFREFCRVHRELDYGGDNDGFLLQRNPDTVLSPDASLFRRRGQVERPWRSFAPEIVVEVLSPTSSPIEMAVKRHRYFDAGTEQFWLVDPVKHQIEVHHRGG